MSRRTWVLALACVAVLATTTMRASPADAGTGTSIREVDLSDFPWVHLIVSTKELPATGEGAPLGPEDVRVLENGLPVQVTDVGPLGESGRIDAVLAIDISNSMRGEALLTALAAARTFVQDVPRWMPVGLVTFSEHPKPLLPITVERAAVGRAVGSIDATTSQGTALFDAVAMAATMFDTGSTSQHNLILVTDGRNTTGEKNLAEAVGAAQKAGMHVFTIGLPGPSTDEATLQTIATQTGGTYAAISAEQLTAVYAGLARELVHQDMVVYRSKVPYGAPATVSLYLPGGVATTRFLAPAIGRRAAPNREAAANSIWTSPPVMGTTATFAFLAALSLALLLAGVGARRRRERQLRSRIVQGQPSGEALPPAPSGASSWIPRQLSDAAERGVGTSRGRRLKGRLERAGWSLQPGEFLSIVGGAVVVASLVGALVSWPIGALVGAGLAAALAAVVPFVVLSRAASQRLSAFQAQLADTLMVIASSMRAGHSFLQSLDSASKEIGEPAGGAFARVLSEIRLGRDTDEALEALVERMQSQDLEWAVTAIKIQRKVGGNLAELLETVAKTIRERETLRRQVRVLSAEGRLSVIVLTALPILIAAYLMTVNPEYLRTLTSTTAGIVISALAGVLMALGFVWMRKIVKIDV